MRARREDATTCYADRPGMSASIPSIGAGLDSRGARGISVESDASRSGRAAELAWRGPRAVGAGRGRTLASNERGEWSFDQGLDRWRYPEGDLPEGLSKKSADRTIVVAASWRTAITGGVTRPVGVVVALVCVAPGRMGVAMSTWNALPTATDVLVTTPWQ